MFKGITFASPDYFYLLLLIPVLVAWYFYRQKKNNADIQVSSTAGFDGVKKGIRLYLYHGLYVLRMLALVFLILALTRPQSKKSRHDISVEGIDIVLALDISGSMMSMDFKPNRIEAAKNLAMEFVDGRPNDRIGLVIFSSEAFTQCPLTTDHAVLKNLFQDIHTGMIEDGTAIGDGLATCSEQAPRQQGHFKSNHITDRRSEQHGLNRSAHSGRDRKIIRGTGLHRWHRDTGGCSLPGTDTLRGSDNTHES